MRFTSNNFLNLTEEIESYLYTYTVSVAHDCVDRGIQSSQFDLAFEIRGRLFPVGSQVLAMAAPRRKELN